MGRVINTDSAGKKRTQLSKAIVLAIRELMKQTEPNRQSHDLAAFIALACLEIYKTVNISVEAWEKRGYWVKADRFRLDWEWTEAKGQAMKIAARNEDWANVALVAVQIAQKLSKVTVPLRNRIGTPWVGAWKSRTA